MRKLFVTIFMVALSSIAVKAASLPYQGQASVGSEMTYSPASTRFALWSPNAQEVKVNIYTSGLGGQPVQTIVLSKASASGAWTATQQGDLKGKYYTFQIKQDGKWYDENPGTDAKAVGVNGKRGAIIDLRDTNPAGWENDRSPVFSGQQNVILYEMHHRDFSMDPESGIRNNGKFLALTETGTKNAAGLSTGIDHLKELGITHVHILPSYDYGSIDEVTGNAYGGGGRVPAKYNWGYDPVNYNAPEGSYSTDASNPAARIKEFKQMVMSLHKAGIRVVMDVVYNHVFDHDKSPFNLSAPQQYFRYKKDANGKVIPANGSGCGNETASEKECMRQYIVNSVKYWMKEYHVDGFRFDLMGIHDIETMNAVREAVLSIDPNGIVYGEGWAAESPQLPTDQLAMKANTSKLGGIAAFGDEMRDGLRGGWQGDEEGAFLIGNAGNEESVKFGIVGAIQHPGVDMSKVNYSKEAWATQPTQMISYVSCHDDMCIADRLMCTLNAQNKNSKKKVGSGIIKEQAMKLQKLAETAVLTSQGVPFIWNGDEIFRDRKGVHNCFSSPDSINTIPWANKTDHKDIFDYVKGMISLRKAHPAFRMGCADLVRENLSFLPLAKKQQNVIAYQLNGKAVGDSWNNIIVILNSNRTAQTVAIPEGTYTVVVNNGTVDLNASAQVKGKKVVVPAQCALIMYN